MTPILDFEPLAPIIDSSASMAYFGKVVVLPLTYQSIEVPLPEKMDTTIKVYDNTTEIRAVSVSSAKTPGIITIIRVASVKPPGTISSLNDTQTMQLLNPTDLAVLSHTGELLYVSNQYMPFNEQIVPMKVDNALQAINADPPAPMVNLPMPPVMPEPKGMNATNYEQLRIQVITAIGNIERNSYVITKRGTTVYANVLFAQASEVYTSVVSLLNFGQTIKEIKSMIEQIHVDMVNLAVMTNYAWLNPKQYDELYIEVAANRALASQAIAVAYSIFVMDAVYKRNILNFWNEWLVKNNNNALLALKQMRESAKSELLEYKVVFSESSIIPTAQLIDAIVFPKINKPSKTNTPPKSIVEHKPIWFYPVVIAVPIGLMLIFSVILVFYYRPRSPKAFITTSEA
jgi:hypothetical protein